MKTSVRRDGHRRTYNRVPEQPPTRPPTTSVFDSHHQLQLPPTASCSLLFSSTTLESLMQYPPHLPRTSYRLLLPHLVLDGLGVLDAVAERTARLPVQEARLTSPPTVSTRQTRVRQRRWRVWDVA